MSSFIPHKKKRICTTGYYPERERPSEQPGGGKYLGKLRLHLIYMLNQAASDREILTKQLNISPHKLSYVTHSGEGDGLLFYGNVILPFVDRFPADLELYRFVTTKLSEVTQEKEDGHGGKKVTRLKFSKTNTVKKILRRQEGRQRWYSGTEIWDFCGCET